MNQTLQVISVLAAIVVPFYLGSFLGKRLRMKNHGWRIGLVLSLVAIASLVLYLREPKWGIDLRGGVILNYEVDEERTAEAVAGPDGEVDESESVPVDMPALIESLQRRINPSGVREIVIRQYGSRQVEIIIPEVTTSEIEQIKAVIAETGFLKFRILADKTRNSALWNAGELALSSENELVRTAKLVKDDSGKTIGEWVRVGRDEQNEFRVDPRMALSRELIPGDVEVLMAIDEDFNVEGKHLRSASASYDDTGNPSVNFTMTAEGAVRFGGLTGTNLPDKQAGTDSKLGIIMDEVLLSAPSIQSTITSNGEITGRFTQKEVDRLVAVLRAGKLPAVLSQDPISENQVSALLGEDTIQKGKLAIAGSLVAVLLFMQLYYRFAGFVACLALLLNLLLIVAAMMAIQAAFTLPGLAGLVLTVGMSVDANVLIFERIREELNRGATLRMAIRNGFGRATTTIVDANVTTLITAVILYVIGTDQIKGFAVTLILGILMSMFTAIFCSRIMFDIFEQRGWLKKLTMAHFVGETHIGFISKRYLAGAASILCILVGLFAVYNRGVRLLDIDFTGGTSVTCMMKEPMGIADIRGRTNDIADDVWVTGVTPEGRQADTVYKIDASLQNEKDLQEKVSAGLSDDGRSLLVAHKLEFSSPRGNPDAAGNPAASSDEAKLESDTTNEADGEQPSANEMLSYRTSSELKLDELISAKAIQEMIEASADQLGYSPRIKVSNPQWNGKSNHRFNEWNVQFTTTEEETNQILAKMEEQLSRTPVWLSSSKIGGKVAGDMQRKAIAAVGLSLIGIVGYIWIRFQRVTFGLAAVVALVHDVAVTLGVIAPTHWVAPVAGFLLIDEFKISLPIVAAFLTIIGYSLNDTIVVFDRIREVKGKSPDLTAEMIDNSINQTLSRTILTSFTTLIVVLILYAFGGQGVHGFAFALLVGVVVGTYSSIFVASPVLLWMSKLAKKRAESQRRRPVGSASR